MEIDLSKSFEYLPKLAIERVLKVFMLIEAELPFTLENLGDETVDNIEIEISDEQFSQQGLTQSDIKKIFPWIWKEISLIDYKFISKTRKKDGCVKICLSESNLTNFLEFGKAIKEAAERKDNEKIQFKTDYKNGILYFHSKEIDFNKKRIQKELLDVIFTKPEKTWFYDEIEERSDISGEGLLEENYWKKYYNAGGDINQAVAIETQIKDFIKKTTKDIRINPKYL